MSKLVTAAIDLTVINMCNNTLIVLQQWKIFVVFDERLSIDAEIVTYIVLYDGNVCKFSLFNDDLHYLRMI